VFYSAGQGNTAADELQIEVDGISTKILSNELKALACAEMVWLKYSKVRDESLICTGWF
jgi:DNA-binding HxlR family transcriptional regulator